MVISSIIKISQMNMKGLIRDVWEKDLKQIMENNNNVMLLNLQKQILELQIVKV